MYLVKEGKNKGGQLEKMGPERSSSVECADSWERMLEFCSRRSVAASASEISFSMGGEDCGADLPKH